MSLVELVDPAGWLVDWLAGWLGERLAGWEAGTLLAGWLPNWLAGSLLADWLAAGSLAGSIIFSSHTDKVHHGR